MWSSILLMLLASVVQAENVRKKYCKGVDLNQCSINSVDVGFCNHAPAYCLLKSGKKYPMTLDLTPKFTAEKLMYSMRGDVKLDGKFSYTIQKPKDCCGHLTCPLNAEERRIFDLDFTVDKKAHGRFPIEVKLWNAVNETQACCFTFNVKRK